MATPTRFQLFDSAPAGIRIGTLEVADITNIRSVNYGQEGAPEDNSHTIEIQLEGSVRSFIVSPIGQTNADFVQAWCDAVAQQGGGGGQATPIGPAGGDLSGTYPNPSVIALQGNAVSANTPATNEVLTWTGTDWQPEPAQGGAPTGAASGDLSGTYPNPTVVALQGNSVSTNSPSTNEVLTWTGSSWEPAAPGGGPPTGAAGGDLDGTYPNPTVDGLQGNAVSAATPSAGDALIWNGAVWAPTIIPPQTPTGTAGGDLSGTYPNPTVDGIQTVPVDATAPLINQVLVYDGVQWSPSTVPAATPTGVAGGDLNGTYPNPTVDGLQGNPVAGTAPAVNEVLAWNGAAWEPAAGGGPPSGAAGGDLNGTYPNPTVDGLQGNPVAATAPGAAEVLTWNGAAWEPAVIPPSSPTGAAGGDLNGTYPNPTVDGLQGNPVAATAPNAGEVLSWNGASWTPTAVGVDSLQASYNGGQTISTDSLEQPVTIEHTDASGAHNLLTLDKSPSASLTGDALVVTMGANANGNGVNISQVDGPGVALLVDRSGTGGDILAVRDAGNNVLRVQSTGEVNVTPTSGEDFVATASVAGQVLLTGGSGGGTTIDQTLSTTASGAPLTIRSGATTFAGASTGGDIEITAGAHFSSSGGRGGNIDITAGSAQSTNLLTGRGGSIVMRAGSNANVSGAGGGDVTISGGETANAAQTGGGVFVNAGQGATTTDPGDQGAITIGGFTTNVLNIGNGNFSTGSQPSSVTIKGHNTFGPSNAGGTNLLGGDASNNATVFGGFVLVRGGSATSTDVASMGGTVDIQGGSSSGFATGGSINIVGGTAGTGGSVQMFGGVGSVTGGANVSIDGGRGGSVADPAFQGSVLIGTGAGADARTNEITIGGASYSAGASPGDVTVRGHATSVASVDGGDVVVQGGDSTGTGILAFGGFASVVGGDSTNSIGGSAFVQGGVSTNSTGGSAGAIGGNTDSAASQGGTVSLIAGTRTGFASDSTYAGDVSIGEAQTNDITIGGSIFTAGPQPGDVEIFGHRQDLAGGNAGDVYIEGGFTLGVTSTAGTVFIDGGQATGANGSAGNVEINAGSGPSTPGFVRILNTTGDLLLIGDTLNSRPVVQIHDGQLQFTFPTDGATNPTNTGLVNRNTLYAKNIVKGWVKGFNQTSIDEAFGLTSLTVGAAGNSAIVTWQQSTASAFDNCYATAAAGTTTGTARFMTVGNYAINSCRVYSWVPTGGTTAAASLSDWGLIRMGRHA